ncbi:MAG: NAD-dependent epimerase/dehydratase family protein [Polaromonas sp.]|jgi:UDP-glucose 4-epimerase
MNILLTGAEGNFGTEFCRQTLVKSGVHVIPVGRGDWAAIDEKMAMADVIVHAASDLRTSASLAPTRLLDSNIMSTATLLEAAQKRQVKRFVFLSSCAVYGEDMRTGEDSLCCPITINGISKHLNEKLVAEFCTANGIEFQILRVFNSYGGDDRFSIFSKLKRALQNGTPFTLNNDGRMQRDFIHITDVASVVLQLLSASVQHTHLNIGTGIATKISTLVDMVQAQFPQLVIQRGSTQEAEYSRADITRLREFWRGDFIQIEDYVRKQFTGYVAS